MSLGHTLQATCGTLPSNENELLTHTLQARCGTFTLLPILASTIEPAAAGCVETRSQSDRLKLETRSRSDRMKLGSEATPIFLQESLPPSLALSEEGLGFGAFGM